MKSTSVLLFWILVAPASLCQEKPVTSTEFVLLLDRFASAMQSGFSMNNKKAASKPHGYKDPPPSTDEPLKRLIGAELFPTGKMRSFDGNASISRFDVALCLNAVFERHRPSFRNRAVPAAVDTGRIRGRVPDGSEAAMLRLARYGALSLNSPILSGPADTVSPSDMSAAIADVAARIAAGFTIKEGRG